MEAEPDNTHLYTTIEATSPVFADGVSESIVTVQLKAADGNNINESRGAVNLAVSGYVFSQSIELSEVTDNRDGTYTATVTNEDAETRTITGTLNAYNIPDNTTITFDPPPSNAEVVGTTPVIADGSSTSQITIQLKDNSGNNITRGGSDVALSTLHSHTGLNFSTVTDNNDGTYSATLSSTEVQGVYVTVFVSGVREGISNLISFQEAINFGTIPAQQVNENTVYRFTPILNGAAIGDVTHSIIGGADFDKFTIDPGTGEVSMVARNFEVPVDADGNNTYEVTVRAQDDDGNFTTTTFTVSVQDVSESLIFTIDAIADATVNENQAYTATAPSISGDTPAGSISWSLSGAGGTDNGRFQIDANTGVVSMVGRNFESPLDADGNNQYEVSIRVTDQDNNSASTTWTVEVLDVIELATFEISPIANVAIDENVPYTSVTPSIVANPDNPIGNLTYTLGGIDANDFSINANTGGVSMVARDFESPADDNRDNVYSLEITATDEDGNFDDFPEGLKVLGELKQHEGRVDCIQLSWKALLAHLEI